MTQMKDDFVLVIMRMMQCLSFVLYGQMKWILYTWEMIFGFLVYTKFKEEDVTRD